jgi:putative membrane protein
MSKAQTFLFAIFTFGEVALGCNNGHADSTNSPAPPITTMPVTVSKDDAKFVADAVEGGMMEVQLGQLAQQKARSEAVKSFGSIMEKDHTSSGSRLKALAGEKSIVLAAAMSPDMQKKIDRLKNDDKSFDKDYIELMVDDHKEDIKEFGDELKKGSDADIRAFADSTLHMLHIHLDSAQSCQRQLEKI